MSRTPGAAESHSEALVEGVEPRVTEQMVVLMLNNQFSDKPKYAIDFRKLD